MPSRFIFQCNVERLIPRRTAAPAGRPVTEDTEDVLPFRVGQRRRRGGGSHAGEKRLPFPYRHIL
jgi:hypothetical protein